MGHFLGSQWVTDKQIFLGGWEGNSEMKTLSYSEMCHSGIIED